VRLDDIRFEVSTFDALSPRRLYAVLRARVDVFVVEQHCAYPELDGFDLDALHLVGAAPDGEVVAYARLLAPGVRFDEVAIGRVLTRVRGEGLGRALMERALVEADRAWPGVGSDVPWCRIAAQAHLEGFYASLGFEVASAPFDEDGIPHVEMTLAARPRDGLGGFSARA
jgi:ElaA protein